MEQSSGSDLQFSIPGLGRGLTEPEIQLLRSLAEGSGKQTPEWRQRSSDGSGTPRDVQPIRTTQPGMRPAPETPAITSEDQLPHIDARVISEVILNAESDDALVLSPSGKKFRLHHGGIFIAWTKITGQLDLTAVQFPHPIRFANCAFTDGLTLDSARLGRIAFEDCHLSALYANAVHVDGDLDLPRTRVDGIVDVRGARIGGVFQLDGAVVNEAGFAARAIDANNARVGEDILLGSGFHAFGETCMRNTTVDGHLNCGGGKFENPTAHALVCDSSKIRGDVLLNDGFVAVGKVGLLRASIGGNVRCESGSFSAPDDPNISVLALDLQWARIESNLYLIQVAHFQGGLDLRDAHTRGFADDGTAWPNKGGLRLDGFRYERFTDAPIVLNGKGRTELSWAHRLEWLNLQEKQSLGRHLNPQPFVQLSNVLHAMGHYSDAQIILQKRENIWFWCVPPTSFFELLSRIAIRLPLMIVAGHGYRPLRAVGFLALFWAISVVMFQAAFDRGALVHATSKSLAGWDDSANAAESFDPWIYSLDVVVPFLDLREEQEWAWKTTTADETRHVQLCAALTDATAVTLCDSVIDQGWARWWLRYGAIIGGLFLSFIAVAGFTGLVQRDRFGGATN